MKHTERLLQWFTLRSTITPLQALRELGIYRLGARVFDLREAGHDIHTELMEVHNAHGGTSRIARYHYRGKAHANPV
jgi:hypothetical protein